MLHDHTWCRFTFGWGYIPKCDLLYLFRILKCCPELLLTLLASRTTSESLSSLVLSNTDNSATGSTDAFLSSRLRFTVDSYGQEICLLQTEDDEVGVMMGWEHGISEPLVIRIIRAMNLTNDSIKCRKQSQNYALITKTWAKVSKF